MKMWCQAVKLFFARVSDCQECFCFLSCLVKTAVVLLYAKLLLAAAEVTVEVYLTVRLPDGPNLCHFHKIIDFYLYSFLSLCFASPSFCPSSQCQLQWSKTM